MGEIIEVPVSAEKQITFIDNDTWWDHPHYHKARTKEDIITCLAELNKIATEEIKDILFEYTWVNEETEQNIYKVFMLLKDNRKLEVGSSNGTFPEEVRQNTLSLDTLKNDPSLKLSVLPIWVTNVEQFQTKIINIGNKEKIQDCLMKSMNPHMDDEFNLSLLQNMIPSLVNRNLTGAEIYEIIVQYETENNVLGALYIKKFLEYLTITR